MTEIPYTLPDEEAAKWATVSPLCIQDPEIHCVRDLVTEDIIFYITGAVGGLEIAVEARFSREEWAKYQADESYGQFERGSLNMRMCHDICGKGVK